MSSVIETPAQGPTGSGTLGLRFTCSVPWFPHFHNEGQLWWQVPKASEHFSFSLFQSMVPRGK